MKNVSMYFGKQQDSVLGSYADIIKLNPVTDEEADALLDAITQKDKEWVMINIPNGKKLIRLPNILWIDIVNAD